MPGESLAEQRIRSLFELADEMYEEHPDRSQRYVDLARRIAMRTRTKLPPDLRRRVCEECKGFLKPGVNCRVRIRQRREPHIAITCFQCGHITRIPIGRRKE
jgi:ribonuclease P protein subunit RPR2